MDYHVQSDPTHELARRQVDRWIKTCDGEHQMCSHVLKEDLELPTRILDLNSMPNRESMVKDKHWNELFATTKLKLVETSASECGRYVALSYCWGTTLAYKTTRDTKQAHLEGIDFRHLPLTLQDAVMFTRYLGLRYLWVDCLCIIQDDNEDWQRQASRMGDIYLGSYLTIAAARAKDSSEGFLGTRPERTMASAEVDDGEGAVILGLLYIF